MNKREVVWLIVRLIGLYFAYCAIVSIFSLAAAVSTLYSASSGGAGSTGNENSNAMIAPGFPRQQPEVNPTAKVADPAGEKAKSEAFKSLLLYLFLTGLYAGLAFYLIKRGGLLFAVLNNESSFNRQEKDPTVTTLKL